MIIVEKRLAELFATLPVVTVSEANSNVDYSVFFQYGDVADFDLYLKQESQKYPVLWLETGFDETHNTDRGEVTVNLSFKIATSALKATLLNQQRIETTFGQVLFPVLESVRKAFERSNIVNLQDREWEIVKFYNYGDADGTEQTEIIDAIQFNVTLAINEDCLKPFNYG